MHRGLEPSENVRRRRVQVQRGIVERPSSYTRLAMFPGLPQVRLELCSKRAEGFTIVNLRAHEELLHEETMRPCEMARAVSERDPQQDLAVAGGAMYERGQTGSECE